MQSSSDRRSDHGYRQVAVLGALIVIGTALAGCAGNPAVRTDEAGIVERIEWADPAEIGPGPVVDIGTRILPASTNRRIVIGVWYGTRPPKIRVSTGGHPDQLTITIELDRPPGTIGEVAGPYPIAIVTREEVDLSNLRLEVVDRS